MSKLIVGNQKAYINKEDIDRFINNLCKANDLSNVVICPSYIYIPYFINKVDVGSQDISIYDNGAYTGDITCSQIKSLGIKYSIVGHSERREYYQEKDENINKKISLLIDNSITPILCIGETREEREKNKTQEKLINEIDRDLINNSVDKIIIAYEPIWAIGTGLVPKNSEIEETIDFIKNYINKKYNTNVRVLYGGSVNSKNIEELNNIKNIDGYLIGGASTKDEFIDIINLTYPLNNQ